jgi:hypothetical protein
MQHVGVVDLAATTKTAEEAALDDLWPRVGQNLRKLLKAAAAFTEPYSTQQLADALGSDVATTKSWRANLGRSLNAVYKSVPSAPKFFEEHPQPGGGWLYSIHPVYRQPIAARDLAEPYADGTVPEPE